MPYIKLWKESLNSDGQQFHQYLQNGNKITCHLHTEKGQRHMLEIQFLGYALKCCGVDGL